MRVAGVVLAAGGSTRMGSPKQLALLGAERLLERAVRLAREAGCSPVVVVLGASAESIAAACELGDTIVVKNKDWAKGMGSSLRTGVEALQDVDGCVVMTCDMPAVTADHLRLLMASGELTASSYAGRRGVPAYFPARYLDQLFGLEGDSGARDLVRDAQGRELENGALDVDTVEDLERARKMFPPARPSDPVPF